MPAPRQLCTRWIILVGWITCFISWLPVAESAATANTKYTMDLSSDCIAAGYLDVPRDQVTTLSAPSKDVTSVRQTVNCLLQFSPQTDGDTLKMTLTAGAFFEDCDVSLDLSMTGTENGRATLGCKSGQIRGITFSAVNGKLTVWLTRKAFDDISFWFEVTVTAMKTNVTNVTAPVYETTTKSPVTVSANETTTKSSVNNATEISDETFRNDFRCGETAIEVFIPAYLVPNSQLTLRDESCKLVNNGTHYVISFPYNQCGTSEIFYSQQILVTNEIKVQSTLKYVDSGPVKFVTDYTIPLNCFPGGNQTVSSVLQILAPEKFQEGVLSNARFEIREYKSANYQEQITAYPVKVPLNREIYFELALTNARPNTNSSIQVSKCQATPSNNPNDKTNYLLVSNGCSASPAVQILARPSPDLFRFSSQAFQFSNGTDLIYVHCYVSVCSSGQCTLPCGQFGRARRSLRGRLQSDLVTLTSSGFQVVTE